MVWGGSAGYSQPISDLNPDQNSPIESTIQTYAAFTFDSNNLIQNLGVFMDRWQLAADLWNRTDTFPQPN
jgi:hypothetical protein